MLSRARHGHSTIPKSEPTGSSNRYHHGHDSIEQCQSNMRRRVRTCVHRQCMKMKINTYKYKRRKREKKKQKTNKAHVKNV